MKMTYQKPLTEMAELKNESFIAATQDFNHIDAREQNFMNEDEEGMDYKSRNLWDE